MNRTQELDECLAAIWNSSTAQQQVVVSDDSPAIEVQQQNRQVIAKYPFVV